MEKEISQDRLSDISALADIPSLESEITTGELTDQKVAENLKIFREKLREIEKLSIKNMVRKIFHLIFSKFHVFFFFSLSKLSL